MTGELQKKLNKHAAEPPPLPGSDATPEQVVSSGLWMHWPTVVFGAAPATFVSLPAVFGILQGFVGAVDSGWRGIAYFLFGLSWWSGVVSLWIAARSRPAIERRTALGLVFGLIGAVLYIALGATKGRPQVELSLLSSILLVGPVWISLTQLKRFLQFRGTAEAARQPRAFSPPSEKSMRRVELALRIVLFIQAFTGVLFGATMLSGSAGLGGLGVVVMMLPFALGVAVFAVWAFIRHRHCRLLAGVVFFAPAIVSNLFQLAAKVFGEPAVTAACGRAVPWVPLAAILLFPRTAGRLIPRFLRSRGANIAYLVIQGLMLVLWVLIVVGLLISAGRGEAEDLPYGFLFVTLSIPMGALSILIGIAGSLIGYVALFRRREERFAGLSVGHMILGILLLTIGVFWLLLCTVFWANPG